jgi:phosphinothricin acetyltransferase
MLHRDEKISDDGSGRATVTTTSITRIASTASFSIRQAKSIDTQTIASIYNEAIANGASTMDTEPVPADVFIETLNNTQRESLLVGSLVDEVVAWGIVKSYSPRPGYQYACETSVYVAEAYQQIGFGSALQSEVMRHARALGYRHLVAKILAVNENSVRFHRRFGYEIVGQQRNIGYLNGHWHDVVIMQCVLDHHEFTAREES